MPSGSNWHKPCKLNQHNPLTLRKSIMVPKSLHTVTALINVAKLIKQSSPALENAKAVEQALNVLGYNIGFDDYKLTEQAIAKLNKTTKV